MRVLLGACVVLFGGCAWFYLGGRAWFYSGGHAWFYSGGMRGFIWGVCVVLFGGHAWFYLGACMVLFGGCMVLFGGACVLFPGGVRVFFSFFGYNEIRSMSGRYASYWNAFLFTVFFCQPCAHKSVINYWNGWVIFQHRNAKTCSLYGWSIGR